MMPGDIVQMKRSLLGIIDRVTLTRGAMGMLNPTLGDGTPVGFLRGKEFAIIVATRQTDKSYDSKEDLYDVAVLTSTGTVGWSPGEMVELLGED